jgi:hypothetical protein
VNFHKLINEIYDIFEHFEDLSLNLNNTTNQHECAERSDQTPQYTLLLLARSRKAVLASKDDLEQY